MHRILKMGPKYIMFCIFAKLSLVSTFLINMLQMQFRSEILVTLQFPVEILLCVILDVMIYFTRRKI